LNQLKAKRTTAASATANIVRGPDCREPLCALPQAGQTLSAANMSQPHRIHLVVSNFMATVPQSG
jgi:hypothetical protein